MTHTHPTTLRLSAAAIDTILGEDPEFKVELQRCVVAEIVRRLFPSDAEAFIIQHIRKAVQDQSAEITKTGFEIGRINEIAAESVRHAIGNVTTSWSAPSLSPSRRKEFVDHFDNLIRQIAEQHARASSGSIERIVEEKTEKIRASFEANFESRLSRAIDRSMEAEINRRVTERLQKVINLAAETIS